MDNDVLRFVTHEERLKEAEGKMVLAYYDYMDNTGSSESDWFWQDFQEKRLAYKAVKDEFPETTSNDSE